jgi:hypothetical protein
VWQKKKKQTEEEVFTPQRFRILSTVERMEICSESKEQSR